MLRPALLFLVACQLEQKPPEETDTDTDTDSDTDADSDTDTDTDTPFGGCVTEQDLSTGVLGDGWVSPSGTLYAVGAAPSAQVRAPDGTWTSDLPFPSLFGPHLIDGVDDDTVWAVHRTGVIRRESGGTWVDAGLVTGIDEIVGIHVAAADDVRLLRVEDAGCDDCPPRDTPHLVRWDGAAWSEEAFPSVDGYVQGFGVLPDGTALLGTTLGVLELDGTPVPTTAVPPYARQIEIGADGTIVAFGWDTVSVGTFEDGLVLQDPGVVVDEWTSAAVNAADDIWLSGQRWEQGVVPYAVVVHWDGAGWTPVITDDPAGRYAMVGAGDTVFALGGYQYERVLIGDADGFAVDRDRAAIGGVGQIAVDDVTGEVWTPGLGHFVGRYTDGAWEPVLVEGLRDAGQIAVSDGRMAIQGVAALLVWADGVLVETPWPDVYVSTLAASDGVLFAAGRVNQGDSEIPGALEILRDAGAGWVPLDLAGMPSDVEPRSAWADGSDDLWLGVETEEGGALVHWDGTAWTRVVDLAEPPNWFARLPDGQLYFTQFQDAGEGSNTLWVYDGTNAAPVPDMPPDVRAAHVLSDGTWFAAVIARATTGDEGLYWQLLRRAPGGDWEELLRSGYGGTLGGTGDTVWSGYGTTSWTLAPCDPTDR